MNAIIHLFALGVLFLVLSWIAKHTVRQLELIGRRLGLSLALLSIVLGIFTTLPEFSIALNALAGDAIDISLGNLLGGVIVLLGFILGVSALTQRPLTAALSLRHFAPALIYLILPLLLGVDGQLSRLEGITLLALYFPVAASLIHQSKKAAPHHMTLRRGIQSLGILLLGAIGLLAVSHAIIQLTLRLVAETNLSTLTVGLVVFSIGTNLPEIVITLQAARSKRSSISLVYVMGSAIVNTVVIGALALIQPISITPTKPIISVCIFLPLLIAVFAWFYRRDHTITRWEGAGLLALYLLFAASQLLVVA